MKLIKIVCLISIYMFLTSSGCNPKDLNAILANDETLNHVLKNKDEFEVQIRYTQIDRDKTGLPKFKSFDFNVDNNNYFYPASTVKMPVAILALQKIRELERAGVNINFNTTMQNIATKKPQTDSRFDEITKDHPNVKNYVEEIFSISDNNAHNRLFEFLGAEYINNELYKKGVFTSSRIVHRLGISGFSPEDHQYTNSILFLSNDLDTLHKIEGRKSQFSYKAVNNEKKGKGYIDGNEKLIEKPFDFSKKNYYSIVDLENTIKRVLFPETFSSNERFDLKEEDYKLIYRSMRSYPREVNYLASDPHYYDTYVKYFYPGDTTSVIPDNLKILNKVGWAYGYLTDCSYIFDTNTGMEFLITAAIKVNKDGIFNDGIYEYESVGLPFFKALGKKVIAYEQGRKKKYKTDFREYLR